MNLTNDSSENDNDKDSSSDEDEDNENLLIHSPTILVEKFFSADNLNDEYDSSDDDISDIENHSFSIHHLPRQNRLCTLLRQSNPLIQLKLNLIEKNHSSLRHARSDSDMSKQRNDLFRTRRLYLPSSSTDELQTQITNWLQASTRLIDSISASTYHRQCWSQLLLTYFIERRFVNLQFILCTHSLLLTTTPTTTTMTRVNQDSCSMHSYACVPEEDAYKLCSILQKGSKFNIDSNIFDHIRRIIVIKSMQEAIIDNTHLQELYVKQLTSLKQSLNRQQSSMTNTSSIYSKLLLFLSSLYSIKAETMQTLFCQHLLHNPTYSYLVTS